MDVIVRERHGETVLVVSIAQLQIWLGIEDGVGAGPAEVVNAAGHGEATLEHVVVVQLEVDIAKLVRQQPRIVELVEALGSLQVPELIEECIVLLLLEGFDDSIQVSFAHVAWCLLNKVPHLDIDDLLPGLHRSR